MGLFERYLSIWVGLCILAGIGLGNLAPSIFTGIALTIAKGEKRLDRGQFLDEECIAPTLCKTEFVHVLLKYLKANLTNSAEFSTQNLRFGWRWIAPHLGINDLHSNKHCI